MIIPALNHTLQAALLALIGQQTTLPGALF